MILNKQRVEMEKLKDKTNDQEVLLSKLTQEASDKDGRLKSMEAEFENMKSCAEKLRSVNDDLCSETERLHNQLDDLTKKRCELEKKVVAASEDLVAQETRHRALLEESQANEIERHCLEGRIEDLENQVKNLRKTLEEEFATKLLSAEEASMETAQELELIKEEKIKLQEKLEDAAKEVGEVMKEKELITSLRDAAQVELDQLEKEVKTQNQMIKDIEAEKKNLLAQNQTLNEKIEADLALITQLSRVEGENSRMVEEISRIKDENSQMVEEISRIKDENSQMVEEIENSRIKKENSQMVEEISRMKDENTQMVEESSRIKDENSRMAEEISELETNLSCLQMEIKGSAKISESLTSSLNEKIESERSDHEAALQTIQSSLDEAEAACSELVAEVKSLKVSLTEITSEKNRSDELADSRLSLIHDYKEQVEQLATELSRDHERAEIKLNKMKDDLERHIIDLQKEIATKDDEIRVVLAESGKRSDHVKVVEDKLAAVSRRLLEKEDILEEMESEIDLLQQHVNLKTCEITRMTQDNVKAETTMNAKVEGIEAKMSVLQEELSRTRSELDVTHTLNSELQLHKQELTVQLENIRVELQQTTGKVELLQMDIDDKDEELNELREVYLPKLESDISVKIEEICELEKRVAQMKTDRENDMEEKKTLLQKLSAVSGQFDEEKIAVNSLKMDLESVQSSNVSLSARIQKLDESLSLEVKSKDELQASSAANIAQQAQRISELKNYLNETREEKKKLRRQLSEVENEREKLDKELKSTSAQLKEKLACTQTQKDEIEEMKKIIRTKEEEVKTIEEECEDLHEKSKEARKAAREVQMKVENLEALYDRISHDNTSLREENRNLIDEITTASRTLMDLEDQLDAAESKLMEASKNEEVVREAVVQENDRIKEELESVCSELDQKTNEFDKLVTDAKQFSVIIDNQNQTIIKYKIEIEKLNDDKRLLSDESMELKVHIDCLLSQINDLQIELESKKVANLNLVTSCQKDSVQQTKCGSEMKSNSTELFRVELGEDVCNEEVLNKRINDLEQELRESNQEKKLIEDSLVYKQERLTKLSGDLDNSAQFIARMEKNRAKLEKSLEALVQEKVSLEGRCEEVEAELSSLRSQFHVKSVSCAEMVEKLKIVDEEQVQLQNNYALVEADMIQNKATCSRLRESLINLESKLEDVEDALHVILEERDALVQGAERVEEEVKVLRSEKKLVEERNVLLAGELESVMLDRNEVVCSMQQEIKAWKIELDESLNRNKEVKELVLLKEQEVIGVQSKLASTLSFNEMKMKDLNDEMERMCESLVTLKADAELAKDEIVQLVVDDLVARVSYNESTEKLEQKLVETTARTQKLLTQLHESEQSYLRQADVLGHARDELERVLCESAAASKANELVILKLGSEMEQIASREAHAADEIKNLVARNDDLSRDNLTFTKQLDCYAIDISNLQQEVNCLTDRLRESKMEREKFQLCNEESERNFHSHIEEMKLKNSGLELQVKEAVEKLQDSEKQRREFESCSIKLETCIAELEDKLNLTTLKGASEVAVLESRLQSMSDDVTKERLRHQETIEAINVELEELKGYRKNMKLEIKEVKRQNKAKEKDIAELCAKLAAADRCCAESSTKCNILTTANQQLQNQLNSNQTQLHEKNGQLDRIRIQMLEKKAELEQIHSKVCEKDAELKEIHSTVCEKDAELERIRFAICEKDKELELIHSKVCEKDAELEQLHSLLDEKDTELNRINFTVCEKDAELDRIHSTICEKDAELGRIHSEFAVKTMELENKDTELQKIHCDVDAKNAELVELRCVLSEKDAELKNQIQSLFLADEALASNVEIIRCHEVTIDKLEKELSIIKAEELKRKEERMMLVDERSMLMMKLCKMETLIKDKEEKLSRNEVEVETLKKDKQLLGEEIIG